MIKHFIKYYKLHLGLFILDFSSAFALAGVELFVPLIVRDIINDIIPSIINGSKTSNALVMSAFMVLLIYMIRYVLSYIVNYYGHVLGVRMEHDMRKDLFNHINKLSFTYFDNNKTGHIMSRLVNDLNQVSELAHHGPEDLFISGVTIVGSFIIMLGMNWKLALITFTALPILMIFAGTQNSRMTKAFREMRKKIADVNAQAEDSISGIRVVKSFTNEDYELEKFEVGNHKFRVSREKAFKIMAHFFSGVNFFTSLINIIVIVFGAHYITKGELTYGDLIGFTFFVNIFIQPVRRISTLIETFQIGMAGFHRFYEMLMIEPDIKDEPNANVMPRVEGRVELLDVTFSYNDRQNVLKGINLSVDNGEVLALVGPSGGGKTTLCSLIPRFYELTGGKILIDGIDIKSVTQRSLRENIGIVQQDVFLFNGTIRENISYGKRDATDEEIINAAKRANAHEFIMELPEGYDTFVGERGVKLSGGQKQRVSIARIFLKNPPVLILDEATSALDNETERIIQKSLFELSKDRTTIVIAHRLSTIRNADRIAVITDEGIVEMGSHNELMASKGLYYSLYNAQFEGIMPENIS